MGKGKSALNHRGANTPGRTEGEIKPKNRLLGEGTVYSEKTPGWRERFHRQHGIQLLFIGSEGLLVRSAALGGLRGKKLMQAVKKLLATGSVGKKGGRFQGGGFSRRRKKGGSCFGGGSSGGGGRICWCR